MSNGAPAKDGSMCIGTTRSVQSLGPTIGPPPALQTLSVRVTGLEYLTPMTDKQAEAVLAAWDLEWYQYISDTQNDWTFLSWDPQTGCMEIHYHSGKVIPTQWDIASIEMARASGKWKRVARPENPHARIR